MNIPGATRIAVALLSLSGAGLVGLVVSEGYRGEAYIPVPGDVPTIGYGSTTHDDGSPVKLGDKTDPIKALQRKQRDITRFEGALKKCVTVPMHQHEFDAWLSFTYNVGEEAFCKSTAVKLLNSGDYEGACRQMPRWVNVKGRRVQGLVNRREQEMRQCLGN